jgi:hypothetical protein
VALVEADGAVVLAENADVDVASLTFLKFFVGPGHELFSESVADEFPADVDLPDLHGIGGGVLDRDVDGADFDEGDEVLAAVDDAVGELGVGEFFGDGFLGMDFLEEGVEVFGRVERAEGFDESIASEAGELGEVVRSGRAELEIRRHFSCAQFTSGTRADGRDQLVECWFCCARFLSRSD